MSEIARDLNEKLNDYKKLKSATGFTLDIAINGGCLMHLGTCDISERSEFRMDWVVKAIGSEEVTQAILKKAAELCKEDIDSDMKELADIIVANKALTMSMGGLIQNQPEVVLVGEPKTEPKKPKHAGGRPRKAVKAEEQPKKKRGRPRKVVEVSTLTVGEEVKAKPAKIVEPSVELKSQEQSETVLVPTYHEPCKTCRKSRRDASGNYPPCNDGVLKVGSSGIETCELWWERR